MSEKPQSPETDAGNGASESAPRKERPKAVLYGWEKVETPDPSGDPALAKTDFRARASFSPTSRENTLAGMIRDLAGKERKSLLVIQDPRAQRETGELITDLVVSENRAAPGQAVDWHTIAIGHVVNSRKDGKAVDFSTVLLSPQDPSFGTEPIRVKETAAMTPELHKRLGFTQDRVVKQARDGAEHEQGASRSETPASPAAAQKGGASRGKEDPLDVQPEDMPAAKGARKSRAKSRAPSRAPSESFGPSM